MGEGLRFRNKMAYDLIRGIDQMMGLRTQFVHLYVKDETSGSNSFDDYGLYTQVEQLNKARSKRTASTRTASCTRSTTSNSNATRT